MIRYDNLAALALRDVERLALDLARLLAELLVLLIFEGEGELELVLAPLALRVELRAVGGRVLAHGVVVGAVCWGCFGSICRTTREAQTERPLDGVCRSGARVRR